MRLGLFLFCLGLILLAGCGSGSRPVFDGQQAYQFLSAQCGFGPRNPGSPGHHKALEFLKSELEKCSNLVKLQSFSATDPVTREKLELTNLQVTFYPQAQRRILLCAHWDTRPWADRDPDSTKHSTPIMGANDGASGVAILLQLARIISQSQPKFGVDMVFFDGEDMGTEAHPQDFCQGSQFFAQNSGDYRPQAAILLDMVGDSSLKIYKEEYSSKYAPGSVELVWGRAKQLKLGCFVDSVGYAVWDDHVPLLQKGIPCADIIDFTYPYWHTMQDTPDKCSAASLEKVGRLLVSILYD